MEFARSFDGLHLQGAWVSVGVFDGIHRGHQTMISSMTKQAHTAGFPSAVITFYPSPAAVLRKNGNAQYLTLLEERTSLIAELGVDYLIALEFSPQMADMTAEEFILQMVNHLGLSRFWAGYDFALGRNREGNLAVLKELGKRYGFDLEVIQQVQSGGEVISSSRVRSLLAQGEIKEANRLLGRWYSVSGLVAHGDGRGRTLGIPTANLEVSPEKLLPLNGVFASWAWFGGLSKPAVVNIGVRPTFDHLIPVRRVEAHILDFDADIYGQEVRLDLVDFVRPEKRFENAQDLVSQVNEDIRKTRQILLQLDVERGG